MELCFNSMNGSPLVAEGTDTDLPGQIEAAAGAGFRLFGPDADSVFGHAKAGGSLQDLAERIADAGLRVFELPSLVATADARETRERAERLARLADLFRPQFVQLNVTSRVDGTVLDELRRARDELLEFGTQLAIEALPWLPEVRDIPSARALMDALGQPQRAIVIDTWHFFQGSDGWPELEALPLDEIAYVQFNDHAARLKGLSPGNLLRETLHHRVFPGEGCFELERFVHTLRAKGFDGVVSCEILSRAMRNMDHRKFAERARDSTLEFWK